MGKVIVTINPKTSEVKYSVEGVEGASCTDLTEALVRNNEHLETQYTEEYCKSEELPEWVYKESSEEEEM